MSILEPLYDATAHAIVGIHGALQPLFGKTNGFGWALSIVLLTMAVRTVVFPLFVKQIRSQRQLQLMQPRMKEIRDKYKNDRQKMNEEMMKLQKEHGNPLLGCLPVFAQIPLFIALFRTLNAFQPRLQSGGPDKGHYIFVASHSLSRDQVATIGNAKIFGASLATSFKSAKGALETTGSSLGAVRVVAVILIIIMAASTFLTQRQMMARNGPTDPSQRNQQRIFLYLSPAFLAIFGFSMPVGVLVYWFTTNLWSMGQQYYVIKRMPAPLQVSGSGGRAGPAGGQAGPARSPRPTGGGPGQLPPASGGRGRRRSAEVPVAAPPPVRRLQQRRDGPSSSPAEQVTPEVTPGPAPVGPAGTSAVPLARAAPRPSSRRPTGGSRNAKRKRRR